MTIETEAAAALRAARSLREPIAPIDSSLFSDATATAYRIQQINVADRLARGARIVGRKIGLTSRAVQRQLGVQQPDFGVLLDDMMIASGDTIDIGHLIQPRIEAEIAFVLKSDLLATDPTLEQVANAIDYALAAAEIVDSAIADWRITLFDTIADNASCGLFVPGDTRISLLALDLRLCGMILARNGEEVAFGTGAACLGNPLNAVQWLAQTCSRNGAPLRAGEIILSGALGPMITVRPGDHYRIEIAALGSVEVRFSGGEAGRQ